MNIFFLDSSPDKAARLQVNKSLVKMCLETGQILSDGARTHGYNSDTIYKGAYHNHPSVVWARRNAANYEWLCLHGLALCDEYTARYGKIHKSQAVIQECFDCAIWVIPGDSGDAIELTEQDLAIKSTPAGLRALEQFKASNRTLQDAVIAYSRFYAAKDYVIKAALDGERCG